MTTSWNAWQNVADFVDTDGESIGRGFHKHAPWAVPTDVWIEEGPAFRDSIDPKVRRIYRRSPEGAGQGGRARMERDLLARFAGLADSPEEGIVSFVKRFGVLNRCWHGHVQDCKDDRCMGGRLTWRLDADPDGEPTSELLASEPVELWRVESRAIRGLLNMTAANLAGRPADMRDCRDATGSGLPDDWIPWWRAYGDPVRGDAEAIAHEVNRRLVQASARLGVGVAPGGFAVQTTGGGLYGAIALQLLLVVTGAKAVSLCGSCSMPFTPSAKHRKYCPTCSAGVEARRARDRERKRRQRARERSG